MALQSTSPQPCDSSCCMRSTPLSVNIRTTHDESNPCTYNLSLCSENHTVGCCASSVMYGVDEYVLNSIFSAVSRGSVAKHSPSFEISEIECFETSNRPMVANTYDCSAAVLLTIVIPASARAVVADNKHILQRATNNIILYFFID